MGIEPGFEHFPATWANLIDDRGAKLEVRSRAPYGYFLRRGVEAGTLDRALEAQAKSLGAEIHFGRKLAPEEADIVATGPGPADGIAKEIAFKTTAPDRIEVIFDPDLAPGGYAYFFVLSAAGPPSGSRSSTATRSSRPSSKKRSSGSRRSSPSMWRARGRATPT